MRHHASILITLVLSMFISACAMTSDGQLDDDPTEEVAVVTSEDGQELSSSAVDVEGVVALAACSGGCGGWSPWETTGPSVCSSQGCAIHTFPEWTPGLVKKRPQIRYRACQGGCVESQTGWASMGCSPACLEDDVE